MLPEKKNSGEESNGTGKAFYNIGGRKKEGKEKRRKRRLNFPP